MKKGVRIAANPLILFHFTSLELEANNAAVGARSVGIAGNGARLCHAIENGGQILVIEQVATVKAYFQTIVERQRDRAVHQINLATESLGVA